MAEPIVSIRDLTYKYSGQQDPAPYGMSLEVAEGEFVGITGHSGGGRALCARR